MQQFDGNGRPLSGARLFLFDGGTSTPRIGYRDSSLTSPHPNPILADSAGRLPLIYLDDGFYRHRMTTRAGALVFDDDGLPVLSSTAGGSGTSVDPDSVFRTRDIKIRFDDQPLAGYVRLNGRTIGSASSGATERANADTQSLYEELWSFQNIPVTGGKGTSAAADFAANKPLVLPDMAGRLIAGMDDMGNGQQSRITSAVIGSDPAEPGSTGGAQTLSLAQANLPSYTLTGGSGSVSVSGSTSTDGSHSHTGATDNHSHAYQTPNFETVGMTQGPGGLVEVRSYTGSSSSNNTGNTSANFTTNNGGSHNHTFSATGAASGVSISSGGSGTAINKLPPLMVLMIYIRL
jgi:hypothetical protein